MEVGWRWQDRTFYIGSWRAKLILACQEGGHLPWVHQGYLPGANQIDLFMHFLGASRDGLVARRVDLNTISSSVLSQYDMVCLLCMCGVGISLGCGVPSSARWLAIHCLLI